MTNAVEAIQQSLLRPVEMARRLDLVLTAVELPYSEMLALAETGRKWSDEARNALNLILPPDLKRIPYGKNIKTTTVPVTPPLTTLIVIPAVETRAQPEEGRISEDARVNTVVLLGVTSDYEATKLRLRTKGFFPLPAVPPENYEELLTGHANEVCGIIIAASFWSNFPDDQHLKILRNILCFSSFCYVKLDTNGLAITHAEISQEIKMCRGNASAAMSTIANDARIGMVELVNLATASKSLSCTDSIHMASSELNLQQTQLLQAATAQIVRNRNIRDVQLTRMETKKLTGGRSGAHIIHLKPDDIGAPLIAKIANLAEVTDEMNRFQMYIRPWDDTLNPAPFHHNGNALILFSVVEDINQRGEPAPTLESRMENILYDEINPSAQDTARSQMEHDMRQFIEFTVKKISELNCLTPSNNMESKAWLGIESVEEALRRGVELSFVDSDGLPIDIFCLRTEAMQRASTMLNRASVHGDVQLRNILVRDRQPHFIDYALSGPGHPCFDLVRLESAMLFGCCRMTGDEQALSKLFLDILMGACYDKVKAKHPALLSSVGMRLAVYTSIQCRQACVEIMEKLSGSIDDYLAVKYIVTCQNFFYPDQQAGIVRASLLSLALHMRENNFSAINQRFTSQNKQGAYLVTV